MKGDDGHRCNNKEAKRESEKHRTVIGSKIIERLLKYIEALYR